MDNMPIVANAEVDQLEHLEGRRSYEAPASFERRLSFLVALLWVVVASAHGDLVQGLWFCLGTIIGGEVLLWCFGLDYAFGQKPAGLAESESTLDDLLHPTLMTLYALTTVALVGFGVTNPVHVIACFVFVTVLSLLCTAGARIAAGCR